MKTVTESLNESGRHVVVAPTNVLYRLSAKTEAHPADHERLSVSYGLTLVKHIFSIVACLVRLICMVNNKDGAFCKDAEPCKGQTLSAF